jgi:predicted metal-dependent phosphoesterase TrpH
MNSHDLHIHSSFSSDGEFSPEEIVAMAQRAGLTKISITDHNSVRGVKAAMDATESVEVIPGIEIDCWFQELNLHVLGYEIDIDYPAFAEIERRAALEEENAFPTMIQKLRDMGFRVDEQEVRDNTSAPIPVAEDIAEVMLASDENRDDPRLDPYRLGGEKSDMPFVHFYYDYCAKGKPAYAEKDFPALSAVIAIIKNAGGIPVLAHPGASLNDPDRQLPDIIAAGVEGIEVFSSYHSEEQAAEFRAFARVRDLRITRGSDFHGKNKPNIQLGECIGACN